MPLIALPDLAVIALCLVALLAAVILEKLLTAVIPDIHIPVVGNLRTKVHDGLAAAIRGITHALDWAVGGTWHIVLMCWRFIRDFWTVQVNQVREAYHTAVWLVDKFIPREVGKAVALAHTIDTRLTKAIANALSKAEHWALARVEHLAAAVRRDITRVEHYAVTKVEALDTKLEKSISALAAKIANEAHAAEVAAKAAATAALQTALGAVNAAITATETKVAALSATLTSEILAVEDKITSTTTTAVDGAITAIDDDIKAGVETITSTTTAAVAGAISAAQGGLTDVTDLLGEIDLTNVGDMVGLATLAGVTAATLAKLAEDCIIPNCRNLSGLGRFLQDIGGLVEGGFLVAFIAEAATDPEGFASDAESLLAPIASDAETVFRDLLGV